MSRTSVPCDKETKEILELVKREHETWDDTLQRLASEDPTAETSGDDALTTVLDQLEELNTKLETLDASSSDDADFSNMNELREAIRMEVKNAVESALANYR